jgi:hypothetical protein
LLYSVCIKHIAGFVFINFVPQTPPDEFPHPFKMRVHHPLLWLATLVAIAGARRLKGEGNSLCTNMAGPGEPCLELLK